jgi:hypothetical protein
MKNVGYTSATVYFYYSTNIGTWMNYENSLEDLKKIGIYVDSIIIKFC